jgi:hypothetical protein
MSTLGNGLVIAGAIVGVATVALVATGTEITLTPAMIQLLIYKGLGAAAVGLIIVGSWVGRRGRQQERDTRHASATKAELPAGISLPYNDGSNANVPIRDKVELLDSE